MFAASVVAQVSRRGLSDAASPIFARKPISSCPVGQYDYGGGCQSCRAGYKCVGGTASPQTCNQGTYAPAGSSTCTACPSGQYTNQVASSSCTPAQCGWAAIAQGNGVGAISQTQCGEGNFSAAGSSSCMACPAGSYCNSGTTCQPQMCQPGRYAPSTGASNCLECPAGMYVNSYGSTSCCKCCAGSFNSATSQTHCQACPEMTGPNGRGKVTVTSDVGSTSSGQCHAYKLGDPAPIPSACVDSSATLNQPTCPATTGPQPSGYRKRNVPRGCTVPGHTRCEVKSGRGGWECIDTNTTLDACGSCDNDCSATPYAGDVSCVGGQCQVSSCQKGFKIQHIDGTSKCVPTTKHGYMLFEANMGLLH